MAGINDKLIQLAEAKSGIKDAIIAKGVEVDASLPFLQYADKIREISSGGSYVKKPNVILNSENLTVTDDNIISGFALDVFARFGMINLGTGSWEVNTKIKTPPTFTFATSSNIGHIYSGRKGATDYTQTYPEQRFGVNLYVKKITNTTVNLCADISNAGGTGWLFSSGGGFLGGTLNADTIYYVRLSFNGTDTYKIEYSTNGIDYTVAKQSTSTTKTYPLLRANKLGIYGGAVIENPFLGLQIYLEDTYIKAGDDIVWKGTIDVATT